MKKQLYTMYFTNGFGSVSKMVLCHAEYGRKQYAQYPNAPFVKYIQKGKRKLQGITVGYKPYILILKGENHPEPNDMFNAPIVKDGLITQRSTYSSFDVRYSLRETRSCEYKTDFETVLNAHLATLNTDDILFDVREI